MLKKSLCAMILICSLLSAQESTELSFPSSRPSAPKGSNLFVLAEWLYLQANETGLSYAINNEDFDVSDDTIMGSGHTAQPKFDWHSGIRLGLGYNLPHDDWDIRFIWTWYEDQADDAQHSYGQSPTVLPIFLHPNVYNGQSIAACNSADANLFLHLNMLDLNLGKQFKLSKALSLRPRVGIRTAWLNQHYNIHYSDLFDKTSSLVLDEYSTSVQNNFWGLGILGGFGSEWNIKWGLSIFGDAAISLLYGFFDNNYSESYITPTGAGGLVLAEDNSFHIGRAIADLQLGLRWASPCLKDRVKIVLQAGWEQHMFFSQNQIMHFVDGQSWGNFIQNQGDVDFQGWSAALHLYF